MIEKLVYVGMCADLIHVGHINIINEASKYGKVCVGVLTDEAVESYKRKPIQDFTSRRIIIENLKNVCYTVPQRTLSYKDNLVFLKPDFVLHGDDWKNGVQSSTRIEVINTLNEWNGKLIEIPYTKNISTTDLINHIMDRK